MKHLKKIDTAIREKRFVKIFRNYDDIEIAEGCYIVDDSIEYIITHNESDFLLDGYSIIQKSHIKKIRYNKYDKYFEMMLDKEGFSQAVGIEYKIDLENLTSIFESIKREKKHVIVECQRPNDERFIIGPIEKIKKKSVQVRYFDATGYLQKKVTEIKFKNITTIQFDTRYLNYFTKYLRRKE